MRTLILKMAFLILFAHTCRAESPPEPETSAARPAVVTHPQVADSELSLRSLRSIYAMKQDTWSDGTPITVFVLPPDNATHGKFCKQRLNIFPNQLEAMWYRQVYTGTGNAPIQVATEAHMLEQVRATPGAIGYLEHDVDNEMVNTLTIR